MLVKTLVSVTCVYITCAAPMTVLAVTRFAIPEFRGDGNLRRQYVSAHTSASALLMVNASVSFVVYITQSSRFRRELMKLLTKQPSIGQSPAFTPKNERIKCNVHHASTLSPSPSQMNAVQRILS